ncbi:NIPSNAP family protein [Aquamicrobium sp. LC103]|uniref:NIPSNAP family protein n=1 Tax=Aquamicrobium sp. LC103 TaxID=1120658 RepID=UPI00069C2B52|nr:NIPSNAP family protein [Aquamicrobium sp. LC103]TKT78160.1 NIPSNAP family protein [Aquamicrobium sp. LC103]
MIYEVRVYEAADGKAEAMRRRFEQEVAPRFPGFGIELLGAFVAPEEDGKLTYVTRFPNEEARKAAWERFGSDPDWKRIKTASESDGPLLARQTVSVLSPAFAGLPLG